MWKRGDGAGLSPFFCGVGRGFLADLRENVEKREGSEGVEMWKHGGLWGIWGFSTDPVSAGREGGIFCFSAGRECVTRSGIVEIILHNPQLYPHPVENRGSFWKSVWRACGKDRSRCQLPRTSFSSPSSSRRKLSLWRRRFSTASSEEMMVEWSRLNIFPMLGRDISVIFRIR